jgi:hypothetical protein
MIASFYPKEKYDGCRTTGCSCCSITFDVKSDKKKILENARENIRVAKEICEFYKIPFSKFCSDILTEKKCKKHKFWLKYQDQEVCWKCDKWKPTKEKK